jgi:hypothetical protein
MSGGSFNYAYSHVEQFADELASKIESAKDPNDYGEVCYDYDQATMIRLRVIEENARRVARSMKAAEWLYSGDTSPETFAERMIELGF